MKQHNHIERFKYCCRCEGSNTEQIGMADNVTHYQFVGWCDDCRDFYGRRVEITTVWDTKGRL